MLEVVRDLKKFSGKNNLRQQPGIYDGEAFMIIRFCSFNTSYLNTVNTPNKSQK